MDVSSVSNAFISTSTQATQTYPEATEAKKAGPDSDRDADDGGGVKAVKPTIGPSVNTNGQAIGQVISVKA